MTAPLKVLFHVQHLLGIGHQVRAGAIARAMHRAGLEVHLVQGGTEDAGPQDAGIRVHRLPPARSADARFSGLVTEAGKPVDDAWRAARRDSLLQVFHDVAPDLVLIEGYPFARRQFRFELDPLIAAAQGTVPIAVSVRDILVQKNKPGRAEQALAVVRAGIDRVLVHGDAAFVPLQRTFPLADFIKDRTVYTGYVTPEPAPAAGAGEDGAGEIVVSAGGGAVGGPLLRAALVAAGQPGMAGRRWRLLVGPNLPAGERPRPDAVPAHVVVESARPDFRRLLTGAALSISQAGYNTMMDLAVTGCRAVLVPFAGVGETEQPLRAELARQRGWAGVVPEAALTPQTLATAVADSLATAPPGPWPLDLGGAARTAALVRDMAAARRTPRAGRGSG